MQNWTRIVIAGHVAHASRQIKLEPEGSGHLLQMTYIFIWPVMSRFRNLKRVSIFISGTSLFATDVFNILPRIRLTPK